MAIDVCSEISISPRISFSYDLNQKIEDPVIHVSYERSLLDSDFDFCCSFVQQQELCCADELFSNGKILPVQIKKPNLVSLSPRANTHHTEKKQLKEFLSMSIEDEDEYEKERACKSFWQFKRSNSLKCDTTSSTRSSRGRGLIRSFQFLTRSNSTPNPSKQPKKLQKQHSVPNSKSPAPVQPFYPYNYYSGQKSPAPALRKCGSYGSTHTHGVTISPVLNISTATVNLFGLPSLFCNTKVKHK